MPPFSPLSDFFQGLTLRGKLGEWEMLDSPSPGNYAANLKTAK